MPGEVSELDGSHCASIQNKPMRKKGGNQFLLINSCESNRVEGILNKKNSQSLGHKQGRNKPGSDCAEQVKFAFLGKSTLKFSGLLGK